MGVYYRLSDVTGKSVSVAQLVQALGKLKRSEVIRQLVVLLSSVNGEGGNELGNQLRMAEVWLSPEHRSGLQTHLAKEDTFSGSVFHPRQIRLALQMAVLSCQEETSSCGDEALAFAVGESCLMASDILHQIEPKDPIGEGPEEANKWMATTLIPLLEGGLGLEIMARARSFWFELPSLPAVQKKFQELRMKPFGVAFEEKYGLSLREYHLILYTLYVYFLTHGMATPALLNEESYLIPTYKPEDVRRVMAEVSQTPDQLAIKLLGEPRQNWAMDCTALKKYPLIEVFPGQHACPDLQILYGCLTEKIYYRLQEAYPDHQFGQLMGYIFEEYIFQLIRQFTYEGDVLARTFFANPKFQGTNDEAGDGVVYLEEAALVIECKARYLTTREKFGGLRDVTLKGIDDILSKTNSKGKKGVEQLANTLPKLLGGKSIVSGSGKAFDLSGCKQVIPVIITLEGTMGLEAIRQMAEKKLLDSLAAKGATTDRVGPLLVLTVGEMELLEALSRSHPPMTLIREYIAYVRDNPKDRAGSFRGYISNRGLTQEPGFGPSFSKQSQQLAFEEARAELEKRMGASGLS